MVAYRFEDSRSGDCALRHLKGYHGILQVDGYAAYQRLARPDRGEKALFLVCFWPAAGRICAEDFMNCISPAAPAWPPPRSSG
jgi:transposase